MNKSKCFTKNCGRVADYPFLDNGESKNSCLECLPKEHRSTAVMTRPEDKILNDIAITHQQKGGIIKKEKGNAEEMRFDRVMSKKEDRDFGKYTQKLRPDAHIVHKNGNQILIEIDEDAHKNKQTADKLREEKIVSHLQHNAGAVKVIRIEPSDQDKKNYVLRKNSKGSDENVKVGSAYEGILKVANHKISKFGRGEISPTDRYIINKDNYKNFTVGEKRKSKTPETQKDSAWSFSKMSNALFGSTASNQKTSDKSQMKKSSSPRNSVILPKLSPLTKKKSPENEWFFTRLMRYNSETEERRIKEEATNPQPKFKIINSSSSKSSTTSRGSFSEFSYETEQPRDICSAFKKSGAKCTYKARANGCCGHHGG